MNLGRRGREKLMNARERFLAWCEAKQADRYFLLNPDFWPTTLKRWREEGLKAREDDDLTEYFGFDRLLSVPGEITGSSTSPFAPKFMPRVIKQSGDWQVLRDSDGVVKRVLRINEDTSMPQFLEFPVKDYSSWQQVKPRLRLNAKVRFRKWERFLAYARKEHTEWPLMSWTCGAFGLARNLMGYENLSYAFYDAPELVHEIEHQWVTLNKAIFTKIVNDISLELVIIWEDMAFKNGPLISPRLFGKFLLPYYRELVTSLKNLGITNVWVDSDGNLDQLIPLFLKSGITEIFPCEVQAGNDVTEIHRHYPGKLIIVGGIDKRALSKDFESIEQEVDRVMQYFEGKKGYIPTLDHAVPPDVSLRNFRYYMDCLKQYVHG